MKYSMLLDLALVGIQYQFSISGGVVDLLSSPTVKRSVFLSKYPAECVTWKSDILLPSLLRCYQSLHQPTWGAEMVTRSAER
jgi:hypothetical protein